MKRVNISVEPGDYEAVDAPGDRQRLVGGDGNSVGDERVSGPTPRWPGCRAPWSRATRMTQQEKGFGDYKEEGHLWVTLATGEYYPDILPLACALYKPTLEIFGQFVQSAHSSIDLFMAISAVKESWMRVQLARVFRKYASPETPVEMLKKKTAAKDICDRFGKGFRKITEVQRQFATRPLPDEALCAILWEYKDRGKKGYDLTERFFVILREQFPTLKVIGPERAGKDVLLGDVFPDYPNLIAR